MLTIYDRNLTKRAILENASARIVEDTLTGIGRFTFTLPADDPKRSHCVPFALVRPTATHPQLYRLLADVHEDAETNLIHFECEHALATLVDDIMFSTHLVGGQGIRTRDVIAHILSHQTQPHWRLGECAFDKQFEYGFQSENLLSALFAVPNLFTEPYHWETDMRAYPWTLHLRKIDMGGPPTLRIQAGRNLIEGRASRTGATVCTRLYLLGYGEGDNQLTIASVNDGKPYLQSPQAYIDRYGLISKVYVDRQFEDAQSLMERGRALLSACQEPRYARTFTLADLYRIGGRDFDRAAVGGVAHLTGDGTRACITKVRRPLDGDGSMQVEIATTARDIAADIADIADRQRIEQVYAQGATQIYAQSVQANATPDVPAQLNFYIPKEMRIVNKVVAKLSLDRFRSYSRVTRGGGRTQTTSSAGGGVTTTSASGGASVQTTSEAGKTTLTAAQTVTLDSGNGYVTDASSLTVTEPPHPNYGTITGGAAGSTASSSASYTASAGGGATSVAGGRTGGSSAQYTASGSGAGSHAHSMLHTHAMAAHSHAENAHAHSMFHTHGLGGHSHPIGAHRHYMSHTHTIWHQHKIPSHAHQLAAHAHRIDLPGHSHGLSIPSHTHQIAVPDHSHEITQGIFRFGSPKTARVLIGGQERLAMAEELEVDLTPHLLDSTGKIPRGRWIRLGVLPDDLAYVTIDLVVQGFVQSRGGGTY